MDCALIWNHLLTGGELRDYFLPFGLHKLIYLHSCLLA